MPIDPHNIPDSLIHAQIAVESGGDDNAIGDKTLKNKAYGCLQIREPVCIDVNRVYGTHLTARDMLGNRALSIDTYRKYIPIYINEKRIGRPVTMQDCARAWNGGPIGYARFCTLGYWAKVSRQLALQAKMAE